MKNLVLSLLLLVGSITSYSQINNADKTAILEIMSNREKCWNKGDLECFMNGYWKSDSLKFIGKKGLTFGWQQTLDNYHTSYPTPEKMGKLTFDINSVEALGEIHILLVGKWRLDRVEDVLQGHYSLTWKKIDGEWKIIADHSS